MMSHPLDHLVLPVKNLDTAQMRLMALGFTVAPVGVHPFGTANCCVFLSDGTFLEPLAVADANITGEAAASGNVFVERDQAYRRLVGEEGFSALVLGSEDANADQTQFREAGISGGDVLQFSRAVVDKSGRTGTATFRLAFAVDVGSPEPFFFTCQRVRAPRINRSALQSHRNGVTGLRAVLIAAEDPGKHSDFLADFSGVAPRANRQGTAVFKLANCDVVVATPEILLRQYGVDVPGTAAGMRLCAVSFKTAELARLPSLFKADGITYVAQDNRSLVVPPSAGQGASFIFEADQ